MKKMLHNKYFWITIFYTILNYIFVVILNEDRGTILTNKFLFLIALLEAVVGILLAILLFRKCEQKISYEKLFLTLAIPIGIMYMLAIPIGRVPDEYSHFLRSYEIASGHLISDQNEDGLGGREFAKEIKEIFTYEEQYPKYSDEMDHILLKEGPEKEYIVFASASLYSFVCYLPQSIGIFVGKIFHMPILWLAYMGRLFNFATWLAILYFTIKYLPFKKITTLAFLLMPMSFQEAVSLSADALTMAVAFALIGFVFYQKYSKKGLMNKKEFIIMCILAILMSLCKIVYLPLCLSLFLIPKERFGGLKNKNIKIIGLAIFVIIINLIWLLISSRYLVEFNPGVNSFEQVKYILTHPNSYIVAITRSFDRYTDLYIFNIIGKILCWFDVSVSYADILPYFVILIYLLILDNDQKRIDKADKTFIALILLASVVLIFTSLYVQWSVYGSNFVDGVQGRYFIPLLLGLSILCNNKIVYKNNDYRNLMLIILMINIYTLSVLFFYHV